MIMKRKQNHKNHLPPYSPNETRFYTTHVRTPSNPATNHTSQDPFPLTPGSIAFQPDVPRPNQHNPLISTRLTVIHGYINKLGAREDLLTSTCTNVNPVLPTLLDRRQRRRRVKEIVLHLDRPRRSLGTGMTSPLYSNGATSETLEMGF